MAFTYRPTPATATILKRLETDLKLPSKAKVINHIITRYEKRELELIQALQSHDQTKAALKCAEEKITCLKTFKLVLETL